MPLSLSLSIDQFSVALTVFENYERLTAQVGDVEYSLNGSAIETGNLHEAKFIWTVSAFVSTEQWRQLWAIYQRSERKRRTQQSYFIQVDDFIEPYIEDSLIPTRAIADGGSIISNDGLIAYPARFGARMFEPKPDRTNSLKYSYIARFTLKELDRIAP